MKEQIIKYSFDLNYDYLYKFFKQNFWPIIDVTRRSVEETAASETLLFFLQNNDDFSISKWCEKTL